MTEPTDAELDELRQANGGKLNFVTLREFRTIARAALAKWGTPPVVAQEPVAHDEDLLEQLYWDFDSQRKKTGEERLAFKGKMRSYASEFRRRSVGQVVFAQSVSDDMMNLADRLGDLPYVDQRAWRHLLVYAPQQEAVPLTDEQIDAVAESLPGGLAGFLKGWGWRQFAREILTLRRMPDWEPQFDCMTPKQEELALQFCQEIAGPRGKRGSPPDPVRLLEMAEALYKAEREHHHGIKGGQHG